MAPRRYSVRYIVFLLITTYATIFAGRVLAADGIARLDTLATLFLGIILEAFPFLLIGILVSSAIEVLVSESLIERIIPKRTIPGILMASVAGLVFPVCECTIVPVAGRLARKGVPLPAVVAFLLAVPILNPLVVLSTFYAFNGRLVFLWLRLGGGLVIAILVGLVMSAAFRGDTESALVPEAAGGSCGCHCGRSETWLEKGRAILSHSFDEFFDVGRFFIIGALLSAAFQTYVPRTALLGVDGHIVFSVLILAALAYILSVCSEADAFIARSFLGQFSPGAVTVFMTLGPMIDVKNTLMLRSRFKRKFVLILIALVVLFNLSLGMAVNYVLG